MIPYKMIYIHGQYAHYNISILTVCISSWTVRNRSLCTNIIINAIILYEDQIARISFIMAPFAPRECRVAIKQHLCVWCEHIRRRRTLLLMWAIIDGPCERVKVKRFHSKVSRPFSQFWPNCQKHRFKPPVCLFFEQNQPWWWSVHVETQVRTRG